MYLYTVVTKDMRVGFMAERHPYDQLIQELKQNGIVFEEGLNNEELYHISKIGGFQFPADLRAFLKRGVPVARQYTYDGTDHISYDFPNWRESPQDILHKGQAWVLRAFY